MRILPNPQNNAVLVYGTAQEDGTVEAMLRKIDILPMQVRIDATIAEVTLNDKLQYGTQFFFKSGGINGILNNATSAGPRCRTPSLGTSFPGLPGQRQRPGRRAVRDFRAAGGDQGQRAVLAADHGGGQPAGPAAGRRAGALSDATSQSTLTANAPVINSIAYQPTGVIMEVTPRVNSGGLVTLDISQEVSEVDNTPNTTGINSPTFNERSVTSRVVVQDGQTIGLAGSDPGQHRAATGHSVAEGHSDLGALAGTQNNTRQRTELLVLITPHVMRDQSDARA